MPSGTKAVLVSMNLEIATNNVRQNVANLNANVQNANQTILQITTVVLANGGAFTQAFVSGNLITAIQTSSPLSAAVTLAGGGGYTKTIRTLMVVDFEVSSIIFTNNDPTNNATLTILSA